MEVERRYWDSSAFLAYFRGDQEKERAKVARSVMRSASQGKTIIVTSALTLAEVIYLRGDTRIPEKQRADIEKLFLYPFVRVYNVTRVIAEAARDVVWKHDVRPKDAVHVATALQLGIERLECFDDPLTKLSGKIPDRAGHLLEIGPPRLRQPELFDDPPTS